MEHSCESVRELIRATLPRLGITELEPSRETGWIRCGYQHCRRFEFEKIRVVWFLETSLVKFYHKNRTVLKVLWLDQALVGEQRAA